MKKQILTLIFCVGCSGSDISFDLAPANETFQQNDMSALDIIDILWVVDNSLSMQTSQTNLRNNFSVFLNQFSSRNMNFQMAVTTSDAYRGLFTGETDRAIFKDTSADGSSTGYKVVTPETPDYLNVMLRNLDQGVSGHGDERAFDSFMAALQHPLNAGFVRRNSYLAIIILSDEDDFSHATIDSIIDHTDPRLYSASSYRDQLDALTNSTPEYRRYSVSAITIPDAACLAVLSPMSSGQKIGHRYMELAALTDGISASLCSNFAESLNRISGKILELITGFRLDRTPKPGSIRVVVNGIGIQEDPIDGWTYDSSRKMITFHGSGIPSRGATISVSYQPLETKR